MNGFPRLVFVGLGSNLGRPEQQLRAALTRLALIPETVLSAVSRFYRTSPWGVVDQPPFINAVAELRSALPPQALLDALLAIERDAGRERRERWGPRVLDLDLLWYDGLRIERPGLTVPHPHAHERGFVLRPWAELAPDLPLGDHGTVGDLAARVDCSSVEPLA